MGCNGDYSINFQSNKQMKLIIGILSAVIILQIIIIVRMRRKVYFLQTQMPINKNDLSGKDLFENISKSKSLYRDLLIELHPDKFISNENLREKAELICSELAENKSSYRDLVAITKKVSAEFEFGEKFKKNHPEIFS